MRHLHGSASLPTLAGDDVIRRLFRHAEQRSRAAQAMTAKAALDQLGDVGLDPMVFCRRNRSRTHAHRRPTKSPYFRHGELTQRIFDALRERGTISSAEVAAKAMRDKGLDPDHDPVTRTDFVRRVGLQFNALQRDGKIERTGKGSALRWLLTIDSK